MTISDPLTGPVTVGVNVTETVQFDPAASWLGQELVSLNPPLAEKLERSSGLPPKLVMVMDWEELVPTFWEKFRVVGDNLMADGRGVGKGTGVTPKT